MSIPKKIFSEDHIYLWSNINTNRRRQLYWFLLLILTTSIFEIIGIGAIFPFISVLTQPEKLYINPHLQWLINFLDIRSSDDLVVIAALVFFGLTIFSGFLKFMLLWGGTRLSNAIGLDLSNKVLHNYLNQPYDFYLKVNSSSIVTTVTTRVNNVIYSTIFPACTLLSSLVILIFILLALILVEPIVGCISILSFGIFYFCVGYFTKKRLSSLGAEVNHQAGYLVSMMQEGFGGIRDVILEELQSQYSKLFSKAESDMRYAQGSMQIIGQAPRYAVETIGTIGIILVALYLVGYSSADDTSFVMPILAVIALGAQRLLPVLQQIYYSYSLLRGGRAALLEVNEVLKLSPPKSKDNLIFADPIVGDIKFKDLYFAYEGVDEPILKNVNIEISRGEVVGIIGRTGGGKSTFLDLLMGLLEPSTGCIYVDSVEINRNNLLGWQKSIAHVPQSIFLADKSISENIAFGVDKSEIDYDRLYEVAKISRVSDFVDSMPQKYNVIVGERGVRLSGGQRQRIGIARALYRVPNLLILDEATSALDLQTENDVVEGIRNWRSGVTIVMVTHRLSSLKYCSKIYQINKGNILLSDANLLRNMYKHASHD